jgi:hypothetical protein
MQASTKGPSPRVSKRGIVSSVAFVAAYFAARGILEQVGVSDGVRIAAAFVPAFPFGWMLWEIVREISVLDELEQRVQLEALAIAFPLTLILLMTLGLLEIAVALPPEDLGYRHVWAMLPVLYYGGLVIAKKRYQ